MGLDAVELVMNVEEAFGIEIPAADCAALTTPRLLADYVARRLDVAGRTADPHCLNQARFYRLRAHLVEHLGIARRAIRPDTPLRELFPGDPRQAWATLRQSGAARSLPALASPAWMWAISLALPVLSGLGLWLMRQPREIWPIGALLVWVLTEKWRRSQAKHIPADLQQLRDLLPLVGVAPDQHWAAADILLKVRELTAEQTGLALDAIGPDQTFVGDLKLD